MHGIGFGGTSAKPRASLVAASAGGRRTASVSPTARPVAAVVHTIEASRSLASATGIIGAFNEKVHYPLMGDKWHQVPGGLRHPSRERCAVAPTTWSLRLAYSVTANAYSSAPDRVIVVKVGLGRGFGRSDRSVSPGRFPHPACLFPGTGRSTNPGRVVVFLIRWAAMARGCALPGSGSGRCLLSPGCTVGGFKRSSHRTGSRCGSPRSCPAPYTTSPPPANWSSPPSPRISKTCQYWPTADTRAQATACTPRSSSRRTATNSTQTPVRTTGCCAA